MAHRKESTPTVASQAGTLDLQISDPVSMLNEIARRYESTERILMEYVDNALDDAEILYRENRHQYPYPIKIEVIINPQNRAVTVRDNCRGMGKDTLERIVQNVGESQKRGLTWVNGRFGFGVQAFRAAAEAISFQSCAKNGPHLALTLRRTQHRGIPGAQSLAEKFPSNTGSGSMVTVSGFEEEWFENITVDSIRQEIESHFERLLARPKLQITVEEQGKKPVRCQAFRYQDVPGKTIERTLNLALDGDIYPVEVHLHVADTEVPGRGVRFFARGRRINHVSEIKSFIRKSTYRTSAWGHPHLLGYIEVGEIVHPVITRDDFVRTKGRIIFYDAILALEDDIKNALDRINEAQRDTTLNRLEDVLRRVLASIARQDRQHVREHMAAQRKIQPKPAINGHTVKAGVNTAAKFNKLTQTLSHPNGSNGGAGATVLTFPGPAAVPTVPLMLTPPPVPVLPVPAPNTPPADPDNNATVDSPAPRRRHGIDIQFFDIPPDAAGQVKRSYMADNIIYINVGHPDFQDRMTHTRQGQPKVTERLGAYIAATVSIHYKDRFYSRYGSMPDRRDLLFDEQVDFIFRLEAALKGYLPELEKELARQKQADALAA